MRADGLEQVERTEGVLRHLVPEAVVAAGPDQPHVAPLDLLRCERRPPVHVVEIILTGLWECPRGPAGGARLIQYGARLRRRAAGRQQCETQRGQYCWHPHSN